MADSESVASAAAHRSIVVVDVADFTHPGRTHVDQLCIRDAMYDAFHQALASSGADIGQCEIEDRGDGILVLLPSGFPEDRLVTALPDALAGEVRRHNANSGGSSIFRLRMAIHAGTVHLDEHGVVGDAVNLAFRLIDAPSLKTLLRSSDGLLALVVSEPFYDGIVRDTPEAAPASYARTRVEVKNTRAIGWMRITGDGADAVPRPPIPGPRQASDQEQPVSYVRQLPRQPSDFTGREAELRRLDRWAGDAAAPREQALVGVLDGMAGSGKTALVVHWAHENVERFPDGQLYVDLHGHAPDEAMRPGAALGILLRALGLPDRQIPYDSGERAAVYRSRVADRQILILLDNAATPAQVRPLLPAAPGPLVLVTSRSRLSALVGQDGARRMTVPVLPKPEAVELLAGPRGADADHRDLETLADLCGRLPLAIRITGERIAGRSAAPLGELVEELADERARLDALTSVEDRTVGVRAAFAWSYQALPPEAAYVFRLFGAHTCPDLPLPALAALAGLELGAARRTLRLLAGLNLVSEAPGERYRLHDLMRVYATELATGAERDRALERLLHWYTEMALIADGSISPRGYGSYSLPAGEAVTAPGFPSHTDAMRWFDGERANLLALVHLARDTRRDDWAWRLSEALSGYFVIRQPWRDWIDVHDIGRGVAQRAGDPLREAWSLTRLAFALKARRRPQDAVEHAERALIGFRGAGDRLGEAQARAALAFAHRELRHPAPAIDHANRAIGLCRELGERRVESFALTALGATLRDLGRYDAALTRTVRAVARARGAGDQWFEALALDVVARIYRDLGRYDEAVAVCERALAMHEAVGDRGAVAMDLYIASGIRLKAGDPGAALAGMDGAYQIFCDIRDRYGKGVSLAGMAEALCDLGRTDEAHTHLKASIALLEGVVGPRAAQMRRLLGD